MSSSPPKETSTSAKVPVKIQCNIEGGTLKQVFLIFSIDSGNSWYEVEMQSTPPFFTITIPHVQVGLKILYAIKAISKSGQEFIENNSGEYYSQIAGTESHQEYDNNKPAEISSKPEPGKESAGNAPGRDQDEEEEYELNGAEIPNTVSSPKLATPAVQIEKPNIPIKMVTDQGRAEPTKAQQKKNAATIDTEPKKSADKSIEEDLIKDALAAKIDDGLFKPFSKAEKSEAPKISGPNFSQPTGKAARATPKNKPGTQREPSKSDVWLFPAPFVRNSPEPQSPVPAEKISNDSPAALANRTADSAQIKQDAIRPIIPYNPFTIEDGDIGSKTAAIESFSQIIGAKHINEPNKKQSFVQRPQIENIKQCAQCKANLEPKWKVCIICGEKI